jgi:dipeptidyl aminopeptidase/acylaminoacyl peptidase
MVLGALALVAACGEEEGGGPPKEIRFLGRVERSATVLRRVVVGGDTIPDSLISWSADLPGHVTFLDSARVRFDSTGTVTFTAVVGADAFVLVREIPPPPTVVFDQVSDSGNRDIWRVALDGQDLVRLTTDAADDRDPYVVGGQVTYISRRGGPPDLWRMPIAGGGPTRLTTTADEEMDPAASAGSALAYIRLLGGIPKLYRSSGGAALPVTGAFSPGAVDGSPSWSPSGDRIAFASSQGGPVRLWMARISTGALDTLPGRAITGADVEPAWSPDGGRIAFASSREGPTEIYLLTLATGVATRLTTAGGTNGRPAWTGDGRILFVTWVDGHPTLRWLDPLLPDLIHEIPVGHDADHPTSPW